MVFAISKVVVSVLEWFRRRVLFSIRTISLPSAQPKDHDFGKGAAIATTLLGKLSNDEFWSLCHFEASGVLSASDIADKKILDWECGSACYSKAFKLLGAANVSAIDSWATGASSDGINFRKESICQHYVEKFEGEIAPKNQYNLIFANTVTEHLPQLANNFIVCNQILSPGGLLIINHDNYYQPVGSHDHGFLFYGRDNKIVQQGPKCWDSDAKCEISKNHRSSITERFPWTWDPQMDEQISPANCMNCPYYKRSQPWAHLLYQNDFWHLFPQVCFTSGWGKKSSLNKVTLFQLRQFLIEAGFDIELWIPHQIANIPPAQLLKAPFHFSTDELTTTTVAIRAKKRVSTNNQISVKSNHFVQTFDATIERCEQHK